MYPTTKVNSAFYPSRVGQWSTNLLAVVKVGDFHLSGGMAT